METYDALMTRRSVPKAAGEKIPDRATVQRLLDVAIRAPNHHLTQPWRFIVLTGDALKDLGEAWAQGAERQLLAAHDMGLGAMLRTGAAATMPEVKDFLGVEEGELIAGFIYLGYPGDPEEDKPSSRRTPAEQLTTWRGWQ